VKPSRKARPTPKDKLKSTPLTVCKKYCQYKSLNAKVGKGVTTFGMCDYHHCVLIWTTTRAGDATEPSFHRRGRCLAPPDLFTYKEYIYGEEK